MPTDDPDREGRATSARSTSSCARHRSASSSALRGRMQAPRSTATLFDLDRRIRSRADDSDDLSGTFALDPNRGRVARPLRPAGRRRVEARRFPGHDLWHGHSRSRRWGCRQDCASATARTRFACNGGAFVDQPPRPDQLPDRDGPRSSCPSIAITVASPAAHCTAASAALATRQGTSRSSQLENASLRIAPSPMDFAGSSLRSRLSRSLEHFMVLGARARRASSRSVMAAA